MNYYRRYVGDYAAKTPHLSMLEHGAYTLLLDAYYTSERALPDSFELLYRICRAQTAAERKAVQSVAMQFFPSDGEFRRNARADKELAVAVPKIDKLRETARANGVKGGRPKKETKTETKSGSEKKPDLVPENNQTCKQPPTASHQPPTKPEDQKRFPGSNGTADSASTFAAAGLEALKAPTLDEAKVSSEDETPAGMLAAVCIANGIRANPFHPLVRDWARDGVTMDRLKAAIATARQRKPAPESIPPAYLDTILRAPERPQSVPWKTDDEAAIAKGREIGIEPRRGEDFSHFRKRIGDALAERARSQVQ